jgi:hypothetical protein
MSDKSKHSASRLIAGEPVKMPNYHYQAGWGKSASVSVRKPEKQTRKFEELQNFVLQSL